MKPEQGHVGMLTCTGIIPLLMSSNLLFSSNLFPSPGSKTHGVEHNDNVPIYLLPPFEQPEKVCNDCSFIEERTEARKRVYQTG